MEVQTDSVTSPPTEENVTNKETQEESPTKTSSSSKSDPRPASPPPNCAICLGQCRNKSFTDSCLHQFCFKCLVQWSKVKAECPLCKQAFRSIIHNVKSNQHYDEYLVEPTCNQPEADYIDMDYFEGPRFRYRTTFTLQRQEGLALERLLMRLPVMPPPPPHYTPPSLPRRSRRNNFRQTVYRHNLWADPLPDVTGRHRECSPEFYRENPAQIHRLMPWLRRELSFLAPGNESIIDRILSLLPVHSILSSHFRHALFPCLAGNTDHFVHEFYSYASSPYDMIGYDRSVHYVPEASRPAVTYVNEILSTDSDTNSSDSDIVCINDTRTMSHLNSNEPSTSSGLNVLSNPVISIETMNYSDSEDSSDEVVMVGYIKPPHERTPEVVDLATDSDTTMVIEDDRNCSPVEIIEDLSTTNTQTNVHNTADSLTTPTSGLVKIKLKRNSNILPQTIFSDTDSEDAHQSVSLRRTNRSKRKRKKTRFSSRDSASTEDTDRDTDPEADNNRVNNVSSSVLNLSEDSDEESESNLTLQMLCKRKQELASKILKRFKMGESCNNRHGAGPSTVDHSLPSTSTTKSSAIPVKNIILKKNKQRIHSESHSPSSDSKKLKIKGRSKSKEKLINKIFENQQVNDGTTKSVDSSKAKVKNKLFNKSFNKHTDNSLPSTSKASNDHYSSSDFSDSDSRVKKPSDSLLDLVSKSILKPNNNLLSINEMQGFSSHNKPVPSNMKHILEEIDQNVFSQTSPLNLSKDQCSD